MLRQKCYLLITFEGSTSICSHSKKVRVSNSQHKAADPFSQIYRFTTDLPVKTIIFSQDALVCSEQDALVCSEHLFLFNHFQSSVGSAVTDYKLILSLVAGKL